MSDELIKDGPPVSDTWEWLSSLRRQAAERYAKLVGEAELNLAFLSGNQYTCYTAMEGITPIRNSTNEVREKDNRILPSYLRMMWELYGDDPAIVAYEGGMEAKDSMSAKCATQICDYLNENNGWKQARLRMGSWMMIAGTAYIMPYWKRNARYAGRRTRSVFVTEPVKTEKGLSHLVSTPVDTYDADIGFEVLSPLSSYCFPLDASCWNDVTSFMTVSLSRKDSLERKLGKKLDAGKLASHSPGEVNFEALSRINRFVSDKFGYAADMTASEDRYLEIQYWERPGPRHPRGRYIHAYGGIIGHDGPLPYLDIARAIDPGDSHNLTMGIIPQFSFVSPGALHPQAPVTNWRPAQIRLNNLLTDQTQNRQAVGRNKLLVQKGFLDEDSFTDEHGEIIEYNPGMSAAPQFLQAPALVGIEAEMDRAEYSLQQATGQSLSTQGRNDTQVRSAMHFEMLRASASTVNWMTMNEANATDALVARFVVQMAKERWDENRMLDVIGRDRAAYYLAFRDAVLPLDIRVKRGSAMSRNYILREETLEKWLQYGLFNADMPPQTRRMFMRATELGYLFDSADGDAPHRNRAGWENLQMAVGVVIQPVEDENHLVHIEEHDRWLQSPEGRSLPVEKESVLRAHMEMHRVMYSSQMAPQLNMPATPIRGLGDLSLAQPSDLLPKNSATGQQPAIQQPAAAVTQGEGML